MRGVATVFVDHLTKPKKDEKDGRLLSKKGSGRTPSVKKEDGLTCHGKKLLRIATQRNPLKVIKKRNGGTETASFRGHINAE